MNPQMKVRITAQNDSAGGFGQVVKDANTASNAVVSAGNRASSALRSQSNALAVVGRSSAAAANQQRNLAFQLNDVAVSIAGGANPLMVLAQQGSQIAAIYGPEEGGLGRAFKETGSMALSLGARLAPLAGIAAAVGVGFAAMTTEINRNQQQQVSFGDVFTATWQLASENVLKVLAPIGEWFAGLWDMISPYVADAANFLIGAFDLAFKNTVTIWNGLPGALGDFTIKTANAVLGGLEKMINDAIGLMNGFIQDANGLLGNVGISLGELGTVQFGEIANPFAGQDQGLTDALNQNAKDVLNTNYIDLIGERARAIAAANDNIAKSTSSAADAMKPFNLGLEAANDNAKTLGDTLASTVTDGFMSVFQTFRSGGDWIGAALDKLMQFADTLAGNALNGLFGNLFSGLGFGNLFGDARATTPGNFSIGNWASYAGGGYTGDGARSGGIDGMGGFPALLHPGESVIDHRRGGSAGGVVININNNSGAQVSARQGGYDAAGRAIIEIAVNEAVRAVEGNMSKGRYRQLGVGPGTKRA